MQFYDGDDSIPGFPSIDAFKAMITPKLKDLKEPALEVTKEVYDCLEELAVNLLTKMLE